MKSRIQRGRGMTLIELVVVLAIVSVLFAIVAAAVMKVREAASRIESTNNMKQIAIALHHFADNRRGELPSVGDYAQPQPAPFVFLPNIESPSLFSRLLPFVEASARNHQPRLVKTYVSPADPTLVGDQPLCSYAANAEVFGKPPRLSASFADGTSNVIALAERYSHCQMVTYYYATHSGQDRPSFADYGDVRPFTSGSPPVSLPNDTPLSATPTLTRVTFQVAPSRAACWDRVPQTPHSGGMLTALMDGSVRQISPTVSPTTFWAAVTPSSSELLGNDW